MYIVNLLTTPSLHCTEKMKEQFSISQMVFGIYWIEVGKRKNQFMEKRNFFVIAEIEKESLSASCACVACFFFFFKLFFSPLLSATYCVVLPRPMRQWTCTPLLLLISKRNFFHVVYVCACVRLLTEDMSGVGI